MELLRSVEVKHQYTDAENLELLKKISEAYGVIAVKNMLLAELKESMSAIKDEIEEQHTIVASIIAKYDQGFDSRIAQCSVRYIDNEAIFTDAESGEIVEQRPMTEAEQLALTEHRVDAESIIRQARAEEDAEDKG